ncbi:hypothetical protein FSB08_01855 [Paraburkholderia sp. JPY432]|uniref:hypothetical protein n=1 Tax=Paraburkholderia youngii TaxID=2782701 RepID=UPI001595B6A1|nr:hypothetical protein [Paraburkholderia youngii]NVH71320.1 hypothetical protein [Paraburkholderia youngii]
MLMRRSEQNCSATGGEKRLFVSVLHTPSGWGMHRMKAWGFGESLDIKGFTAKNSRAVEAVSDLNLAPHARFEALDLKCRK